MNLPAVTCLAVVLAYPIGYAGYLSLHDDVGKRLARNEPEKGGDLAKVIPLFRRSQPG